MSMNVGISSTTNGIQHWARIASGGLEWGIEGDGKCGDLRGRGIKLDIQTFAMRTDWFCRYMANQFLVNQTVQIIRFCISFHIYIVLSGLSVNGPHLDVDIVDHRHPIPFCQRAPTPLARYWFHLPDIKITCLISSASTVIFSKTGLASTMMKAGECT